MAARRALGSGRAAGRRQEAGATTAIGRAKAVKGGAISWRALGRPLTSKVRKAGQNRDSGQFAAALASQTRAAAPEAIPPVLSRRYRWYPSRNSLLVVLCTPNRPPRECAAAEQALGSAQFNY